MLHFKSSSNSFNNSLSKVKNYENHSNLWFLTLCMKNKVFCIFWKQRLFLPCLKSNQFFLGAARIECKKFEVSTMSRFWVIVSTNLFVFLLAYRKCILLFSRQRLDQFQFCFLQNMWNSRHNIPYSEHVWLFCLLFPKIAKNWFLNLTKYNIFTRGTRCEYEKIFR